MNFTKCIKKFVASMLIGAMTLLTINPVCVHAQTIEQVSKNAPGHGIVTTSDGSGLNVRKTASTASDIIVSIPNNTKLMVVGESGDFYEVQYDANRHYGYVSKDYLNFVPRAYYLKSNISSGTLNMRASKSTTSTIIASIPKNTGFAYMDSQDSWYLGVYGNQCGYTSMNYTIKMSY